MLEFLFDLPLLVTGPALLAALCLFAIGGLLVVRRWVLPRSRIDVGDSEFSGSLSPRRTSSVIAAGLIAAALGSGCHKREAPEVALKRAQAVFRREQIASLEKLIAKAEKGELVTSDLIAIGISEELVKALLGASLPQEVVVADRLRVRLESAEPVFRGNKAGLLFRARVSSVDAPNAYATVEMGGTLENFKLDGGKLTAAVRLAHFSVIESSIGDLAADALDGLVRANAGAIQNAIPPVEIPVELERSVTIGGLTEGAVVARPGALPLDISVRHVVPVNQRLWILLQAKAGPWQPASAMPPGPAGVAK